VKKLGFRQGTVLAVTASEKIVRYLNGVLLHLDTVGWKADKQKELLKLAEADYGEQLRAGATFARVDHLLEVHESALPALANGIPWTATLLGELLSRDQRVSVVGNRRNAYIFNKGEIGVRSFADFVRVILEKHFGGAATLNELSDFLRSGGVIHKRVTPAMLKGAEGLVLTRHEVALHHTQKC